MEEENNASLEEKESKSPKKEAGEYPLNVRRGDTHSISVKDLFPGDIVLYSVGMLGEKSLHDMLLISGECVISKIGATGDSFLVGKIVPSEENKSSTELKEDQNHVIYAGTLIKAMDSDFRAIVLRTGHNTAWKRSQARTSYAVWEKSPHVKELWYLNGLLRTSIIPVAIVRWQLTFSKSPNSNVYHTFISVLLMVIQHAFIDLIPYLETRIAQCVHRLEKSSDKPHIRCHRQDSIPLAAEIDVCCFDKTDTLTLDSVPSADLLSGGFTQNLEEDNIPIGLKDICQETHTAINMLRDSMFDKHPFYYNPTDNTHYWGFNGASIINKRTTAIRPIDGSGEFFVAVKGAPEGMKSLFVENRNEDWRKKYEACFQRLATAGETVLALGYKNNVQVHMHRAWRTQYYFCAFAY